MKNHNIEKGQPGNQNCTRFLQICDNINGDLMKSDVNLEIRNLGVISKADIGIKQINVVGGVNSSGKSMVSRILYCFLKSPSSPEKLLENEGLANINLDKITFSCNSSFDDIFYFESISILDLKDSYILGLDHIRHIKECLEIEKTRNSEVFSKIMDNIDYNCTITSSAGIKQIGMIKILLENETLKKDSFLIIDEPESNLHPEWQIRFAHILVLLSKELNITLYLNSHSPMFIEAVSLYVQYYDLADNTGLYLTEKQENGGYDFRNINLLNMGEVYENLTSPYDYLDELKAKILFMEE